MLRWSRAISHPHELRPRFEGAHRGHAAVSSNCGCKVSMVQIPDDEVVEPVIRFSTAMYEHSSTILAFYPDGTGFQLLETAPHIASTSIYLRIGPEQVTRRRGGLFGRSTNDFDSPVDRKLSPSQVRALLQSSRRDVAFSTADAEPAVPFQLASRCETVTIRAVLTDSSVCRIINYNEVLIYRCIMRGTYVRRTIYRSFQSLAIWAMVPLVVMSDRTTSGCVDGAGHFSATCRCCSANGRAKCTCCNGKMRSSASLYSPPRRPGSEQMTASQCRAVAIYAVSQTVCSPVRSDCDQQSVSITWLPVSLPTVPIGIGGVLTRELNTGQSHDNLVIELQRWII